MCFNKTINLLKDRQHLGLSRYKMLNKKVPSHAYENKRDLHCNTSSLKVKHKSTISIMSTFRFYRGGHFLDRKRLAAEKADWLERLSLRMKSKKLTLACRNVKTPAPMALRLPSSKSVGKLLVGSSKVLV